MVLVMVLATGCGAAAPPLQPDRPAREVFVSVEETSLAGSLDEDETAENAPRRIAVMIGSSRQNATPVHELEVRGGGCDARTDGMDELDAVLMLRCPDDEIAVVRSDRALVVRTRNGDREWHDVARQALHPSARVVASSQ